MHNCFSGDNLFLFSTKIFIYPVNKAQQQNAFAQSLKHVGLKLRSPLQRLHALQQTAFSKSALYHWQRSASLRIH